MNLNKEMCINLKCKCFNISAKDDKGKNVLQLVVENNLIDRIDKIISLNPKIIYELDNYKNTALHYINSKESCKKLLKYDINVNQKNILGFAAIHFVVKRNNNDVLTTLLSSDINIDINIRDGRGSTPIYISTFLGYVEITKQLLVHGANPNIPDNSNLSPMHIPLTKLGKNKNSNIIFSLLLKYGGNVNAHDKGGKTLLFYALLDDDQYYLKELVDKKADLNLRDKYNMSAIKYAIENNSIVNLKYLLQESKVNYESEKDVIFKYVIEKKDDSILNIILEHNVDPNSLTSDGDTYLICCLKNDFTDGVCVLLEHKADINGKDKNGTTAHKHALRLNNAASKKLIGIKNTSTIKAIKPIIKPIVSKETNQLIEAIKRGDLLNMKLILSNGLDPNLKDKLGNTPMAYSIISNDKTEALEILLEYNADPNILNHKIKYKPTNFSSIIRESDSILKDASSMIISLKSNRVKHLIILLKHNADSYIKDGNNNNAIDNIKKLKYDLDHYIEKSKMLSKVSKDVIEYKNILNECYYLVMKSRLTVSYNDLNKYTIVNKISKDNINNLYLVNDNIIFKNDNIAPVEYNKEKTILEDYSHYLNIPDIDRETLIFNIIRYEDLDQLTNVINNGAYINIVSTKNQTPLSLAYSLKKYDCVKKLLKNGASPNLPRGIESSINLAIIKNDLESIDLFFRYGACSSRLPKDNKNHKHVKQTFDRVYTNNDIINAIKSNDHKTIDNMIFDGISFNINFDENTTPLILAVKENKPEVIKKLLLIGTVDVETKDGYTAYIHANRLSHIKCMDVLFNFLC